MGITSGHLGGRAGVAGCAAGQYRAYDRVRTLLTPEHFADPVHACIYEAIGRRIDAGQIADATALRTEFEEAGTLDAVGGSAYLAQLLTSMVGVINADAYGGAIRGAWLGRLLIGAGTTLLEGATGSSTGQPEADISDIENDILLDLATDEARRVVGAANQVDETADREARVLLDRIHSGLDDAHARADRLLARLG